MRRTAAAPSVLLRLLLPLLPAGGARAARCAKYSSFEGSEDCSMWRGGIAFQSSGLCPSPTQGGAMLAVDLSGTEPRLRSMALRNVPAGFGFRPHGIHIDNATQRVYAISHSDLRREESIVVFDITVDSRGQPDLDYRYALVSPNFTYHNASLTWFLNDLAVVDGGSELYATQYGPQLHEPVPNNRNKYLWRCTWDEDDLGPDGRLAASCMHAYELKSLGVNGISIDATKTRLWVNDLFYAHLWVFDRMPNGTLVKLDNMQLPGVIDNVEHDFASGDLTMGMFNRNSSMWPTENATFGGPGGAIVAKCTNKSVNDYSIPVIAVEQDMGGPHYQVSTSLVYRQWVVLGSPCDTGPIICNMNEHADEES